MTTKLLRAKHWQIFVLAYGLHFTSTIIFLTFPIGALLEVMLCTLMLFISITVLWHYAVGASLQQTIPEELRRATGFFKIALVALIAFMGIIFILPVSGMLIALLATTLGGRILISLLILFITFCLVYTLYYSAKILKSAELQRQTDFSDFSKEFFLIWFLPIGIWILQPRINKLVQPVSAGLDEEEYV